MCFLVLKREDSRIAEQKPKPVPLLFLLCKGGQTLCFFCFFSLVTLFLWGSYARSSCWGGAQMKSKHIALIPGKDGIFCCGSRLWFWRL